MLSNYPFLARSLFCFLFHATIHGRMKEKFKLTLADPVWFKAFGVQELLKLTDVHTQVSEVHQDVIQLGNWVPREAAFLAIQVQCIDPFVDVIKDVVGIFGELSLAISRLIWW